MMSTTAATNYGQLQEPNMLSHIIMLVQIKSDRSK